MTNLTITVTLKRSFLNTAADHEIDLGTPVKTTKAADTYEMTAADFDAALEEAQFQAAYDDAENKLVAANMRRAGASALATLEAAGRPDEPAKPTGKEIVDNGGSTKGVYDTLYRAFDHFNATLFDNHLPPVMLLLHRKRNAHGYFWQDQWTRGDEALSEIALNPEAMGRTAKEVLSTFVHEMVHHEQHVAGTPSKSGHNVEWCEWMERIDLTPVGVGNCAGKRSGRNFTHEIVEGGAFDKAADELIAEGTDMTMFAKRASKTKKQDYSKVKHTCECGCNIWGKYNLDTDEGIDAKCNECNSYFTPVFYD